MSKTPWLITLLRPTYGASLNRRHRIRKENFGIIPSEGPFLVIGNHVHTLDPLFISAASSFHINWVAGRYLFKFRFLGTIMDKGIGAISKQQGKSDLFTIRTIREKLSKGEVVGLFPEGTRTWDGSSLPIPSAMAKMIRMLKVPVVIIHLEGAFGARPRWAPFYRKGPVVLHAKSVLQPSKYTSLSIDKLTELLNEQLYFSHDAWQSEHHIPFKGKKRAEGIEDLLFACRSCGSFSTLKAKGDTVTCTSCASSWRLDEFDLLHNKGDQEETITLPEWHEWESEKLTDHLSKGWGDSPFFTPDTGVLFQKIEEPYMKTISRMFNVTVYKDRFVLSFPTQIMENQEFLFDRIAGLAVNAKSTIEFSYNSYIYRMRLGRGGSSLRYLEHYQYLQNTDRKEST